MKCGSLLQPYHRTDPQKEAYFQQEDKKGGPTDPLLWFHDHYETILKDNYSSIEEYPLYKHLKQFSPSKPAGESKYPDFTNGGTSGRVTAIFSGTSQCRHQVPTGWLKTYLIVDAGENAENP